MTNSVVVFRAHADSAFNRLGLSKLQDELPGFDIVVVSYTIKPPERVGIFKEAYVTSAVDLMRLPYRNKLVGFDPSNTEGWNELPALSFYRRYTQYEYYWIIEFDVHYTGNWAELFEALSQSEADLLGTTVLSRADYPDWSHWSGLNLNGSALPEFACVKSFMPFARVSRAAMNAIDGYYVSGLAGRFEGTWPAACLLAGLKIEDIGGFGPYTPEKWRGKHYSNTPLDPFISPGTFRFLPPHKKADIENLRHPPMLWHPVKS